jgi:hypothetical protein
VHFQPAGMAGPMGAAKTDNLCLSYLEIHALENPPTTEVERDVIAGQEWH